MTPTICQDGGVGAAAPGPLHVPRHCPRSGQETILQRPLSRYVPLCTGNILTPMSVDATLLLLLGSNWFRQKNTSDTRLCIMQPPPPLVPICIIKYYLTVFIVYVSLFSKQLTCKIRKSPSLLSLSVLSTFFLLVNTIMLTMYWCQYIYSESFFYVKGTKLCCMFSLFPEQLAYEHK